MDSKSESNEPILTIKLPEVSKLTKTGNKIKSEDSDDNNDDINDSNEDIDSNDEKKDSNEKNGQNSSSSNKDNKSMNERKDSSNEEVVKIDPNLLRQKMEEEEREKMQ